MTLRIKTQFLIGTFLSLGSFVFSQKGYTYILSNGEMITSKSFALDIEDRRIQHFLVNDKKIKPYTVDYFYKGSDFFKIERINEKVKRNIFKRYQDGTRIDVYYKSGFVIENFPAPKKVTKKQFYYEKDNSKLRTFNYENLRIDLNGNKESEQILEKIEKQRKLRKLALGIAGGVLIYEGILLSSERNFDALITVPLVLFTFVVDSSNREEKLLRKAALIFE